MYEKGGREREREREREKGQTEEAEKEQVKKSNVYIIIASVLYEQMFH